MFGKEIHEPSKPVQHRRPSSEFHEFGNSFRHQRAPRTCERLWLLSCVLFPLFVLHVIWIPSPIGHMSHEVQGHRLAFSLTCLSPLKNQYCERTMEKLDYSTCSQGHHSAQTRRELWTLATRTHIAEFKEHLSKHLLVKHIATMGPSAQLFDSCEVRFLNRVLHWVLPPFGEAPERTEIEADPRHAELLIKNSGLHHESARETVCAQSKLSPQDATSFRSIVMRLACLSADRTKWQFSRSLRQQHRQLLVSRVPKLNTTQQSRQQLRELAVCL